jgi:hypothetical protein
MDLSGDHTWLDTPVPIPNTAVKPSSADGTARVAWWESRTLPGFFLLEASVEFLPRPFLLPREGGLHRAPVKIVPRGRTTSNRRLGGPGARQGPPPPKSRRRIHDWQTGWVSAISQALVGGSGPEATGSPSAPPPLCASRRSRGGVSRRAPRISGYPPAGPGP